ncbi:MAG: divalent-cation tolerance protein CutA [Acidobacteriota bacterium]|nr:divalent-cation tolerance protein CutA [Acidobacteriota bacterium]
MTSVGSEQQAITIAEELVQQELASCVNIMPTMRSIYRFNGKVFDDEENFLMIKTTADLFKDVSVVIHQMHTYEIPEIMGINIRHCPPDFLAWVNQSVHPVPGMADDGEG